MLRAPASPIKCSLPTDGPREPPGPSAQPRATRAAHLQPWRPRTSSAAPSEPSPGIPAVPGPADLRPHWRTGLQCCHRRAGAPQHVWGRGGSRTGSRCESQALGCGLEAPWAGMAGRAQPWAVGWRRFGRAQQSEHGPGTMLPAASRGWSWLLERGPRGGLCGIRSRDLAAAGHPVPSLTRPVVCSPVCELRFGDGETAAGP